MRIETENYGLLPYICKRVTKSLGIFSVGSYSVFLVVDTFFLELDKLEIIKACHDSQKCAIRRTEQSGYDVDNVIPKFFLRLASPNFMYVVCCPLLLDKSCSKTNVVGFISCGKVITEFLK